MILIDLVYINSLGGIVLAKEILNRISASDNNSKYVLLVDSRNKKHFSFYGFQTHTINKSEIERIKFYWSKKYNKILCFGNVPPPFNCATEIYIYFHNILLLDTYQSNISLIDKIKFWLKRNYIKIINKNYYWFVQNKEMKQKLNKQISVSNSKIFIAPIFSTRKILINKKESNSFIYPTSKSGHKNNLILIKSFIKAAEELSVELSLILTINGDDFTNLKIPKNLKIDFTGSITRDKLLSLYSKTKFLIFPSLKESFGLPLIEGIQARCYIIVSNLNYAKEVVDASIYFDPNSHESIKNSIVKCISRSDLSPSRILVKNSIEFIYNKCLN